MDIEAPLSIATSTPQEAADNIHGGDLFNIGADVFKQYKPDLQPQVDDFNVPKVTLPVTGRYIAQSEEHASLAKPDIEKLNYAEQQGQFLKQQIFGIPSNEEKIAELGLKHVFNFDKVTDDDKLQLQLYNQEREDYSTFGLGERAKKNKHADLIDKSLDALELFPGQVAGVFASMAGSIKREKELVVGATGTGAVAGVLTPIPGGTLAGTLSGLSVGVVGALTIDSTSQQIGLTYNDLSNIKKEDGTPMNIDETTKKNISIGVGVATGVVTALVGRAVSKTLPFFNKLLTPKILVVDPAAQAMKATMFNVGKSITAGGAGGFSQEAIKIYSEELGRTYDGTEANFMKAMQDGADRLTLSTALGGTAAGITTSIFGVVGYEKLKKSYNVAEEANIKGARDVTPQAPLQLPESPAPTEQSAPTPTRPKISGPAASLKPAIDALNTEAIIEDINKTLSSTEMQKLSPGELKKLRAQMYDAAGLGNIYVDIEDVRKFADSSEKAAAFLAKIDPTGKAAAQLNVPLQIKALEFAEIVDEYPEVLKDAKLTPDGPSSAQAEAFLKEIVAANDKQKQILAKLGSKDITDEERATLMEALQTEQPSAVYPSNEPFSEREYMNQPTLVEAINQVAPTTAAKKIIESQKAAREARVAEIDDAAKYEMDQVKDVLTEVALEAEQEAQFKRAEENPNLEIVDQFTKKTFRFKPNERYDSKAQLAKPHHKEGYSQAAIDPRMLTEEQKAKYLKDPQLKKHKVFVKGGISPDESARQLGLRDGNVLLKILSETPSREDLVAQRVKAREADIIQNAIDAVEPNEAAIIREYNDRTQNHLTEMQYMLDHEWPGTKEGIKRIALPMPRKESITVAAQKAVAKTKVKDLSYQQFRVGERRSNRIAIDAVLKNEIEKAFVNKKAAATNSELAKATLIATRKVNQVIRFARKFNKPSVIQEIKDAGYTDAANVILDNFNLRPSKESDIIEKDSYRNYVKRALEQGESISQIPERMLDNRQSINDMSVEEVLLVGEALKNLLHTAKYKNKLYIKHDKIQGMKTIEALGKRIKEQLSQNPDYKPERNETPQPTMEKTAQQGKNISRSFLSGLDQAQALMVKLDNEKVTGLINDLIWQPAKDSDNAGKAMTLEVVNQLNEVVKKYGEKEFANLGTDLINLPKEFKDIKGFAPKISKMDLVMMNLNRGNEGNIVALERFGVDRQVIKTVMERELTHKEMALTQHIWDIYKSFEPKIDALQKRTEGTDVVFVKPEPVQFTDKSGVTREYPGGYFPIMTVQDSARTVQEKLVSRGELANAEKFKQNYYAKAQTEQGHLETRTGSDRVLSLDPRGIGHSMAQTIQDLTKREFVRDTAKLLSDPQIKSDIVAVIGKEGYSNLADLVFDASNEAGFSPQSDAGRALMKITSHLYTGFQVAAIVGKLGSIAVQAGSLPIMVHKMGPGGIKYIAKAFSRLSDWSVAHEFVEAIHPDMKAAAEGVDRSTEVVINKLMPKAGNKKINAIYAGQDWIIEKGFGALGWMDDQTKVVGILAAYMQAMDGAVSYIPAGDHDAAVKYAGNIAELTLTHTNDRNRSPIEKEKWAKSMLFFMRDVNNLHNNLKASARQLKNKAKESKSEYDKGEHARAAKVAAMGVGDLAKLMLWLAGTAAFTGSIKGRQLPDWEDPKEVSVFILGTPFSAITDTFPLLRDIDYTAEFQQLTGKRKDVSLPPIKILNDFKDTYTGLGALLQAGDLSRYEKSGMINVTSYLTHLPLSTAIKYLDLAMDEVVPDVVGGGIKDLKKGIEKLKKEQEGKAEADQLPADFMQQLQDLENQISPNGANNSGIPGDTLDVIKKIESNGQWDAQNPQSTAAGLYQFLESTWNDISRRHPELGLTENGRVSQDTTQQEAAMEAFTQDNMRALEQNGLELSTENIYAAHFLGPRGAIDVLSADNAVRLRTLVSQDVIDANNFRGSMTVHQFRRWIENKVQAARDSIAEDQVDNNAN